MADFRGRRLHERARRRRTLRTVVWLFLCPLLAAGIWYGTRAEAVTIAAIEVSGGTTIDLGKVEQEVQSALDGTYLFLIPKRFAYAYPHDAIIAAALRQPRVAEASVTRTARTALSVTLVEYIPYALWCAYADAPSDIGAHCLYISESGLAFTEAPSLKGATFLRYVTKGRIPEVGAMLASTEYIRATKEFAHALRERHGMYVHAVIETKDGDVRYRLRGGGELIVSKDADIQEVFENLDAILTSDKFKHITSGNFVYIDLRFDDKVFVKEFKTETVATSTSGVPETPMLENGP